MINIGVVGLGNISKRVIKGIKSVENARLYALYSRDINKAKKFKEEFESDVIYDDFNLFLSDNNIDLVYIATSNNIHYTQIKKCLLNNKNVICEKPMLSSIKEVEEMFEIANKNNLFLMEAHKGVMSLLFLEIKDVINKGVIGDIKNIRADYCYDISKENYTKEHWVLQKEWGCLKDIGVYPISFVLGVADSKIKNIKAASYKKEGYECDFGGSALIEFENNINAYIESSWFYDSINRGYCVIFGTKGKIIIPSYWKVNKYKLIIDNEEKEVMVNQNNDFYGEIKEACDCIEKNLTQSKLMSKDKIISIMEVIDYIKNN